MVFGSPATALRHRFERRSRRLEVARGIRESLVSLAGLIGRPVRHRGGESVGRVADVVAHWDTGESYPSLAGIITRVGARRAFVPASAIATVRQREVALATARLDLRDFVPREGETALAAQVLDHQLVDIDGARVVRAADLYLATVGGVVRLVGVDVGFGSLLRRLGPARWRTRPTPEAVIDWASVHSFGPAAGRGGARLVRHRGELNTLRPAELADLLEDLGRRERHELLELVEPDTAADALEEMDAGQLHQLLSEADTSEIIPILSRMEPDEAAEALRSLSETDRAAVLAAMAEEAAARLRLVLEFPARSAGGEMTTMLVLAHPQDTVASLRPRLASQTQHLVDLDAILVVDSEGCLIDEISLAELFVAEPDTRLSELVGPPWPVTVTTDADVREVARRLIDSRRLSVVVLDNADRPVGRILADDVLDAVLTERRWQFPRAR
ncbi:MAG TPA: CBS domain-containing protein [Pseudonocardiaceae bacterium]|nr:CBS domain-containing protein [Pseudonocardiaceae bacterium]